MNGFIIIIFITLYFELRFLKAKDSEDNSGSYSRRPYDAGYPWNRVVPPQDDRPKDFEDREGKVEEYEEEYQEERKEEYEEEYGEEIEEGGSIETVSPKEDFPQAYAPEIQASKTDFAQADLPQMPSPEIPVMEAPVPEAFGLKMPEPMSIPTTEIVVDSEVQLDTEMSLDKFKK